jgi:hypothetical protein
MTIKEIRERLHELGYRNEHGIFCMEDNNALTNNPYFDYPRYRPFGMVLFDGLELTYKRFEVKSQQEGFELLYKLAIRRKLGL